MSSRTTTGSMSLERVNAWERCSVWIAASDIFIFGDEVQHSGNQLMNGIDDMTTEDESLPDPSMSESGRSLSTNALLDSSTTAGSFNVSNSQYCLRLNDCKIRLTSSYWRWPFWEHSKATIHPINSTTLAPPIYPPSSSKTLTNSLSTLPRNTVLSKSLP